jgi:hypothetical protein
MKFSEHFEREEFEKDGPMPEECVPIYIFICVRILEPIRSTFSEPLEITSGYRPPDVNVAIHGAINSEHKATKTYGATDFKILSMPNMRPVFEYVRLSHLPFHQVILEHGDDETDIIHVSYNKATIARQALEGHENNATPYIAWRVAA